MSGTHWDELDMQDNEYEPRDDLVVNPLNNNLSRLTLEILAAVFVMLAAWAALCWL